MTDGVRGNVDYRDAPILKGDFPKTKRKGKEMDENIKLPPRNCQEKINGIYM